MSRASCGPGQCGHRFCRRVEVHKSQTDPVEGAGHAHLLLHACTVVWDADSRAKAMAKAAEEILFARRLSGDAIGGLWASGFGLRLQDSGGRVRLPPINTWVEGARKVGVPAAFRYLGSLCLAFPQIQEIGRVSVRFSLCAKALPITHLLLCE